MKQYVKSDRYSYSSDEYNEFLEQLDAQSYHHDYEMELPEGNRTGLKFKFKPIGDKAKYLPTIEVETVSEDNKIYFTPSMIMPSRIDGDDMEFYDSFEYYMDGYVEAGKLCTSIFKAVYEPGMYED